MYYLRTQGEPIMQVNFSKAERDKCNGQPTSEITVTDETGDELGTIEAQYQQGVHSPTDTNWICIGYEFNSWIDGVPNMHEIRDNQSNSAHGSLARLKRRIRQAVKNQEGGE